METKPIENYLREYYRRKVMNINVPDPPPLERRQESSGFFPRIVNVVAVCLLFGCMGLLYIPGRHAGPLAYHLEDVSITYKLHRSIQADLAEAHRFVSKYLPYEGSWKEK